MPQIIANLKSLISSAIQSGANRQSLAFHLRLLADSIESDWRSNVHEVIPQETLCLERHKSH